MSDYVLVRIIHVF